MLEGCAARRVASAITPASPSALHLAKVLVSPDREIRTTVCLRPFRAPGFRLAAEKLDDKLCVHNYGHGGAGITLSWGCAQLAVAEAHASEAKQVAVLGCGVIGLATARLLQQMGKEVTIYAKDLPPDTTSNSAGGFWKPVMVVDQDRETPQFRDLLLLVAKASYTYFQQFAGDDYGLRWLPTYMVSDQPFSGRSMVRANWPMSDLFPDLRDLQPGEHPFPRRYVRQCRAMLIEPPTYMRALLRDFYQAGGKLVVREFHDVSQITALSQAAVVNCTGLGARALFSDAELTPIKGQLTYLLPQPEVNYIVLADELYMFPRRDGIVLGGTHVRGDWSLAPDLAAKEQILREHAGLFSGL